MGFVIFPSDIVFDAIAAIIPILEVRGLAKNEKRSIIDIYRAKALFISISRGRAAW